jgi:iron complex outermembrane recepter protein
MLYALALLWTAAASAQQINGVVHDDQGKPLAGTTLSLLNARDSSVAKLSVSKADGSYNFLNIKQGRYLVAASHVGYTIRRSTAFEFSGAGDLESPGLSLQRASSSMTNVVVTARKPIIEVKADKTILNVEGTINAVGTDALELLRKSPGVLLDKDDNISLSGKNGVQVYIDGRQTPLSGKDLSDYLRTLPSDQIESIEIITNPSAKYDAAGNAGIINIRLKKNKSLGANGSVNAGWNVGTYPKYNAGGSINYRNKKVNIFSNYSYNKGKSEGSMALYRTVLDTVFDQHNLMQNFNQSHNFKAGLDYFINKKSTVGVIVNGNFSQPRNATDSRTPISYQPTGVVDRILVADNSSTSTRNNINSNVNYSYNDTSGRSLVVNGDYGHYDIHSDQWQPNYYYDASGKNEINRVIYDMLAPTTIDIYSLKADYEQEFLKGKLGIGAKSAYVNTDNDFQRYNVFTSGKLLDTLRSNRFAYKENVNAAYANYNRAWKGFLIQAGLRVENTVSDGRSKGFTKTAGNYVQYDSSFHRNYTDLFPSAAVTFNKNPMKQLSLTYSRRIDRPAYQDLNPFEFKLDEYTFMKGNTQLRPQYTNSFGVTYMYKYRLNTTLNYSHVSDVFTQLVDTAEKSKAFMSKKNLATQDITSLNISYPLMMKNFTSFANLNTYYSKYKADFGTGRIINLDVFAFNVYMQNSLKFAKTWTAEISGFYSSPSIWQGTFQSKQIWSVDGGLQKQVLQGKGTIKASVSDIFHSLKWSGESNFAGQFLHVSGNFESRQLKVSLVYRFGSNQVKAARQRVTGAEEENKRVQSGGGGIGQN